MLVRLEAELIARGEDVETVLVDGLPVAPRVVYGEEIDAATWSTHPPFFRFIAQVEAFKELDLSEFDVVISTQPPSYAVQHPRQLALFYHHERFFYDLSDVYVAAGFVAPDLHAPAVELVRRVDEPSLRSVRCFLAGSAEVRGRLERFNGLRDNVRVFRAPVSLADSRLWWTGSRGHVLCVGRMEFPKRTELFVHAMKYLQDLQGVVVGGGPRWDWVRHVDRVLSHPRADIDALTDAELWLNTGVSANSDAPEARTNVRFAGRVTDDELAGLYATSACVVAPAYLEDYGLTALEAMRHRRPVIVCEDGGGLPELVEHERTGLVVEPTGRAIAAGVRRLVDDPELGRALGENGRDVVAALTWEHATDQLLAGLEAARA